MKIDSISARGRAPLYVGLTVLCAGALLSGCVSSPTYGTGKTANQMLLDDMTSLVSVNPAGTRPSEIAYNARPELVRPATTTVLPEPQQDIASNNPAWPESPEERRARIRADATANQDNPNYRPLIAPTRSPNGQMSINGSTDMDGRPIELTPTQVAEQRARAAARARETRGGDANTRRYLSEPPVEYRRPTDDAAYGDLGEDESVKQRRRDSAGGKSTGLRSLIPWL